MATTPIVSLKLLIDTGKNRVLFAEASKDFVDFLFNLLALPVGTVIKLITKQNMVGCLGNLYDSVENLNATYLESTQNVNSILNPKVQSTWSKNFPLLLNDVDDCVPGMSKLYTCCCRNNNASYGGFPSYSVNDVYVCRVSNTKCPKCSKYMSVECKFVGPNVAAAASTENDQIGYVKGVVTYMVMDDLVVKPMSTISSIAMLNKFNIKEVGALEEKEVELTMAEGVKLLKASFQSKTVLTDVFLGNSAAR